MIGLNEAAQRVGLSPTRLRALCAEGRVAGAVKIGPVWVVPATITADDIRKVARGRRKQ